MPSGNAVFVRNLLKLSKITGHMDYEKKAEEIILAFVDIIHLAPHAFTQMMMAYQITQNESSEIVICGKRDLSQTQEIIHKYQRMYCPDKTVILKDDAFSHKLSELAPYTKYQQVVAEKVNVYYCKGHVCEKVDNLPQTKT